MSEQTRISHPKEPPLSMDVEGFDSLTELALDLRLSWNHATEQLWRQLDPVLSATHAQPLGRPADGLAGKASA
jgi:glycogen phosphorylase